MADILYINPLHERHGSTYRARNLARLLSVNHRVLYVEPGRSPNAGAMIVNDRDSVAGLVRSAFEYLRLCSRSTFEVFYVQKPMVMTLPSLLLARLRKKGVIIDFDDVDSHWQRSWWKRGLASFGERFMPGQADALTTHNRYLMEYLEHRFPHKVVLVPQGVDTELFNPNLYDKAVEKKRQGLGGRTVFCFLGSFTTGSAADLDIILKAFKIVSEQRDDAAFMMIGGGGPLESHYRGLIKALGLDRVIITGRLAQQEVPRYLSCADYGLICMRDNVANRSRASLKLLEYLAMDLTVIGHVVGVSRDVFEPYFIACAPTAESLGRRILEVLEAGPRHRRSARRFIVENYDWERFVPLLDETIRRVRKS